MFPEDHSDDERDQLVSALEATELTHRSELRRTRTPGGPTGRQSQPCDSVTPSSAPSSDSPVQPRYPGNPGRTPSLAPWNGGSTQPKRARRGSVRRTHRGPCADRRFGILGSRVVLELVHVRLGRVVVAVLGHPTSAGGPQTGGLI